MKTKDEIQRLLSKLKKELQKKYPIASIAIFGSYSRGEQGKESDIDLLIEFNGKIGSKFILLADELEQKLGERIDLVSRNGIKPKYFNRIESDLIYV